MKRLLALPLAALLPLAVACDEAKNAQRRADELARETEKAAASARKTLEEAQKKAKETGKQLSEDAAQAAADADKKARDVKDAVERSTVGAKKKAEEDAHKAQN